MASVLSVSRQHKLIENLILVHRMFVIIAVLDGILKVLRYRRHFHCLIFKFNCSLFITLGTYGVYLRLKLFTIHKRLMASNC